MKRIFTLGLCLVAAGLTFCTLSANASTDNILKSATSITVSQSGSNIDATKNSDNSITFTPTASEEKEFMLELNSVKSTDVLTTLDYTDAFVVLEASDNLSFTWNKSLKVRNLKIDDVDGGYANNNNYWTTTLSNGHKIILFSPLSANETLLGKYLQFGSGMKCTYLKFFVTSTTNVETTIYNVSICNFGEFLEMYPELKTKNYRFVTNDNVRIESWTNATNNGSYSGLITIKDPKPKTTPSKVKLMLSTLGSLPDNFTKIDFSNVVLESGQTPLTEDIMNGRKDTITFNDSTYYYFPTMNGKKFVNSGYISSYKDGAAPKDKNDFWTNWNKHYSDYTRSFTAGYNSCILPFKFDVDNLPSGLTAYTFSSVSESTVFFEKVASGTSIDKNTPFVVRAEVGGLYEIYDTPPAKAGDSDLDRYYKSYYETDGDAKFVGSFVEEDPSTTYSSYTLYGIEADGKSFAKMDNAKTSYYRAFLAVPTTNAQAKYNISFDGTTGISSVTGNESKSINVYNLSGVLVKKNASSDELNDLPRGLYIVNGKKLIVGK